MASSQQEFFASQRLHRFGVLALVAAEIWLYFRTPLKDPWLVGGGLLIVFLSAWPALEWARHHRQWFPAFEIFMLTLVNFYAMPLLAGNPPARCNIEKPFCDCSSRLPAFMAEWWPSSA